VFGKRKIAPAATDQAPPPEQKPAAIEPLSEVMSAGPLTRLDGFPWREDPAADACSAALTHIMLTLPELVSVDGRIHAETYLAAAGAVAGFAAQQSLLANLDAARAQQMKRARTPQGEVFWFGSPLIDALVGPVREDYPKCVWRWASVSARAAGMTTNPDAADMFARVTATLGTHQDGMPAVGYEHQPHVPTRALLERAWPTMLAIFEGRADPEAETRRRVPVAWWGAIAAQAVRRPMSDVMDVLPPEVALTIVMETAIYASKLDASKIPRE
jgi:hypothetical protein